jgi:electron-transferring-flavoprotein dehydrogenase
MELHGKYTLFGEGVRGSLTKQLIAQVQPARWREPQKCSASASRNCGKVESPQHAGLGVHTFGWPLDMKTGGGSFLYHLGDNQVASASWSASELQEPLLCRRSRRFQRFKTHPAIRTQFEGGKRCPMARARSPRAAGSRCPS